MVCYEISMIWYKISMLFYAMVYVVKDKHNATVKIDTIKTNIIKIVKYLNYKTHSL